MLIRWNYRSLFHLRDKVLSVDQRFLSTLRLCPVFTRSAHPESHKTDNEFLQKHLSITLCKSRSSTLSSPKPILMSHSAFKPTQDFSAEKAPLIIIHGLFGSKNNWRSISKILSERAKRVVYAVDARNHGDSPHTDDLDYFALAEDLSFFMKEKGIPLAQIIGHSMGGRATMTLALLYPQLVEKLFLLDISPISNSNAPLLMIKYIEAMLSVKIPSKLQITEARKFMDETLKPIVEESSIRSFLLTNLIKTEEGFGWKVNLDSIKENFENHLMNFPLSESGKQFSGTTHFLLGSLSTYVKPSDHEDIKRIFPTAQFHYIEGAGHWPHSDKPQDFLDLIVPLINS